MKNLTAEQLQSELQAAYEFSKLIDLLLIGSAAIILAGMLVLGALIIIDQYRREKYYKETGYYTKRPGS